MALINKNLYSKTNFEPSTNMFARPGYEMPAQR